jgi:acyl-coenzyme A synthetase/AMP-(fatty) acid ligase
MATQLPTERTSQTRNVQNISLSLLHGPSNPPLLLLTLSQLLDLQCQRYGTRECLVIPWTGARWTYNRLQSASIALAKMMLDLGILPGDRVGIMAGNCEEYVAIIFATARIGAILVVLNNTYTASEAIYALRHTECKLLFSTMSIGTLDNTVLMTELSVDRYSVPSLEEVIILYGESGGFRKYDEALAFGAHLPTHTLNHVQPGTRSGDICMLLFTSGSTGKPKAASLTHQYVTRTSSYGARS